jgi:hypothetical protein
MPESNRIAYASAVVGFIIIIYPYLGQDTLSKISGLILLGLFILIFFTEFKNSNLKKNSNKKINLLWLFIAILSLIFGVSLVSQMLLYYYFVYSWLLIIGILLLVSGCLIFYLESSNKYQKDFKNILLALGLIYILMDFGIIDPKYLGIFIGLALIYYAYQRQK